MKKVKVNIRGNVVRITKEAVNRYKHMKVLLSGSIVCEVKK